MESEINILESKKQQLEVSNIYLDDKSKDAEILMIEIHKIEMQLSKEKEENKRVVYRSIFYRMTTKIKKFIKAYNRNMRLQDELKRSQAQFQKLAEQLEFDAAGAVIDDEPKINAFPVNASGERVVSPLNEGRLNSSPPPRRARVHLSSYDTSNKVGERMESGRHRSENFSHRTGDQDHQLTNSRRQDSDYDAYNGNHDEDFRRERQDPDIASSGKYKVHEMVSLPSTGIAAHAVDEEMEVAESDNKLQIVGDTAETTLSGASLPPPVPENAYSQYKGEDETVDIDGVDDEDVDIV
ncbi:hypothetical protein M569_03820 [Genlisea aurea]|uniref:Uncharacterized protein n=1 Tax=Genlisea aurea TaxID=192259 RepID=S8E592_9LAMI|nr:hypothetical protein M569_03820 [Genlisea aurea]